MSGPILIQGAMACETDWLVSQMDAPRETVLGGYRFWQGTCHGRELVVNRTGMGELNAACATTLGILHFAPSAVVNQGIAGAHREELHIGDVVVGESCVHLDGWVTPTRGRGEGCVPEDWTPWDGQLTLEGDRGLLERFMSASYTAGQLVKGRLGSGDLFSREYDRILWLAEHCGHLCEDMESIAVYKVCHQLEVPCLGVRIISNNELTGEAYTPEVGEQLQKMLLNILSE